jgi:hydrogenase expression/formation protein HypC
MCLAVPGKVVSVENVDPAFRSGCVDFAGVRRTVNLAFTPEVEPGDYVLVHVGFAISRVDREEAARTYAYLAQLGALEDEGLAPDRNEPTDEPRSVP